MYMYEVLDDFSIINYMEPRIILVNAKLENGWVFNFIPLSTKNNPFIRALVNSNTADKTKEKESIIKEIFLPIMKIISLKTFMIGTV